MKHNVTMFDLLLSCPGDAYKECYPAVKGAIEKINADPQINNSIAISLKHWSTSSYPQSGGQAQKLLNLQIVNDADIAIAVFWTRFGTPTDNYGSGTEEEINLLIQNKKQVFLYFLDKPVPPSITGSPEYTENFKKITLFRQNYNGIYHVVKDENDLQENIVAHLKLYFSKSNMEIKNGSNKWYRSDTQKEILPIQLLKHGNMKTQIEGTVARVEVGKSDKKTVYAEIDTKNNSVSHIVAEGFPQEYVLDIPQNLIINKKDYPIVYQNIIYRNEVYSLKFNGYIQAIYDINNKLQNISIQSPAGMKACIDPAQNKIYVVDENDIKMCTN